MTGVGGRWGISGGMSSVATGTRCPRIGGAAAPLALLETYAAKGVGLQQLWGMTETGPLGLVIPADQALRKVGSSGLPMQYAELRICDEHQVDVAPGETRASRPYKAAVTKVPATATNPIRRAAGFRRLTATPNANTATAASAPPAITIHCPDVAA